MDEAGGNTFGHPH